MKTCFKLVPVKIFLCGFMGCGKSTHGKRLARLLKYEFIDLDKQIEASQDQTVSEIFAKKGENFFRKLETEQLQQVMTNNAPSVISLGGGTPCFNDNLSLILNHGLLIYIQMDQKSLYQRVVRSKKNRPLLQDKTREELLVYIQDLIVKREPYYLQANMTINGLNLKTEEILQGIRLQK